MNIVYFSLDWCFACAAFCSLFIKTIGEQEAEIV